MLKWTFNYTFSNKHLFKTNVTAKKSYYLMLKVGSGCGLESRTRQQKIFVWIKKNIIGTFLWFLYPMSCFTLPGMAKPIKKVAENQSKNSEKTWKTLKNHLFFTGSTATVITVRLNTWLSLNYNWLETKGLWFRRNLMSATEQKTAVSTAV